MAQSQQQKAEMFASLHRSPGVFPIPNPWDIGSARMLEGLGFQALATTSSGFAQSLGRTDGSVTLEEKLKHCEELAAATSIPLSADLENCYGDDPESVAECIRRAAATGIVGASVEDFTGDAENSIYDFNLAVERVAAAVDAAGSLPFPFMVTARAEQLLRSTDDLEVAIRRLQAYEAAGADVLYAPGLKTLDAVRQVGASITAPLNVLGTAFPDCTVTELGAAGAKRVSIGGAFARLTARALIDAAAELHERGDLSWLSRVAAGSEVERLISR